MLVMSCTPLPLTGLRPSFVLLGMDHETGIGLDPDQMVEHQLDARCVLRRDDARHSACICESLVKPLGGHRCNMGYGCLVGRMFSSASFDLPCRIIWPVAGASARPSIFSASSPGESETRRKASGSGKFRRRSPPACRRIPEC